MTFEESRKIIIEVIEEDFGKPFDSTEWKIELHDPTSVQYSNQNKRDYSRSAPGVQIQNELKGIDECFSLPITKPEIRKRLREKNEGGYFRLTWFLEVLKKLGLSK